jgi:hypothetical protein
MGYLPDQPYALWSIWIYLPLLPRLFLLILGAVTVYTIASLAVIMGRLTSFTRTHRIQGLPLSERPMEALLARIANLRQLITAAGYLFGMIFFFVLRFAQTTTENAVPVGTLILENFFLYFAFATNVFFVFLVLHFAQWAVSSRIQIHTLRLGVSREITKPT